MENRFGDLIHQTITESDPRKISSGS